MGGASKTSDGRGRATARLALAVLLLAALAPWTAAAATGATAPTALQATPGDGRVVLRWIAPSSDGGSPIDDFQVSVTGGPWLSLGVSAPPAVVAGLTNGIEYSFRVRGVTGAGPGAASEPATATPGGVPGPVTSPRITARTETTVTVTWSPPYDDGGTPVTRYEYSLDGGTWTPVGSASVSLAGLAPGSAHELRVRAVNASGPGDGGARIDVETAASPMSVSPSSPASPSGTESLAGSPTPSPSTTSIPTPIVFDLDVDLVIGRPATARGLSLAGAGLLPGSQVSVVLRSTPIVLGTAVVGADGAFALAATLPAGIATGEHFVVARGVAAGGTSVERVGAFVVDAEGRVVQLLQDTRIEPLPGYRPSLPVRFTSSKGKPGVTLARTADGRILYVDERGSTNPLAASVPPLIHVIGSLRNAVVAGFTALGLAILGLVLGVPTELLKSRVKSVWRAIAARFPTRRRSARTRRWIAIGSVVAFLAAGQFLSLLNEPLDQFPPLRQDLQNIVYGVLAVLLMSHVKQRPDIRRHRDVHGDTGLFAAEWSNLALTAVGVLIAQLTGLVPGFVVGVWAARKFRGSLAAEDSAVNTWRSGLTLIGVAIGAWVLLDVVSLLLPDPATSIRGFTDSVLAMFVVGGTQGVLWSLTGPGEDVGRTLREWSLARWGLLVFLASFAVVGIVAAGGSRAAAFFRPSWNLSTEIRLLVSGLALLAVLGAVRWFRDRGRATLVA